MRTKNGIANDKSVDFIRGERKDLHIGMKCSDDGGKYLSNLRKRSETKYSRSVNDLDCPIKATFPVHRVHWTINSLAVIPAPISVKADFWSN